MNVKSFNDVIKIINQRLGRLKPPLADEIMTDIADMIELSIAKNFDVGGRWDGKKDEIGLFSGGTQKWAELAENTKKGYRKLGYSDEPTLNRNKNLRASIDVFARNGKVFISANAPYAAIHQFGGTIKHPGGTEYGYRLKKDMKSGKIQFLKKGRGYKVLGKTKPHDIYIPARPYLVISQDDLILVLDIIEKKLPVYLKG
ncbi:MAG: phage virion morphogenesis protein [Candidatus Kapabacteria bacterium]|nr:phage virion morphogenesis protein [Candidatus Kapabacteria bacterium]